LMPSASAWRTAYSATAAGKTMSFLARSPTGTPAVFTPRESRCDRLWPVGHLHGGGDDSPVV
jgi:hypothetical protein